MAKLISRPTQISVRVKPAIPAWAANAQSGTWVVVPMAATLASIDPTKSPLYNPNYPRAPEWSGTARALNIVIPWCGAAYDETTDTMWMGLGGGHQDYAGNEIYKCVFNNANPAWVMVRRPSGAIGTADANGNLPITNDGQEASGVYSDGRPRAVHGYNKWVYIPGVGPTLALHGNTSWCACRPNTHGTVFINETTGECVYGPDRPDALEGHTSGMGACYSPPSDDPFSSIWIVPAGGNSIYRYKFQSGNFRAGTFELAGRTNDRESYSSVCYLPGHNCLLIGDCDEDYSRGHWQVFDCKTGTNFTPEFNGTAPMGIANGKTQPRWVPAVNDGKDAVCAWANSNNTTQITMLTPGNNPRTDAWTVSSLPGSGVTPTAQTFWGTYGRFAYSPRLGGFFVFNSENGPTYFYKI